MYQSTISATLCWEELLCSHVQLNKKNTSHRTCLWYPDVHLTAGFVDRRTWEEMLSCLTTAQAFSEDTSSCTCTQRAWTYCASMTCQVYIVYIYRYIQYSCKIGRPFQTDTSINPLECFLKQSPVTALGFWRQWISHQRVSPPLHEKRQTPEWLPPNRGRGVSWDWLCHPLPPGHLTPQSNTSAGAQVWHSIFSASSSTATRKIMMPCLLWTSIWVSCLLVGSLLFFACLSLACVCFIAHLPFSIFLSLSLALHFLSHC